MQQSVFNATLKGLADLALCMNGTKYDYTDDQVVEAVMIFQEVMGSRLWDEHAKKVSENVLMILAQEQAESMYQMVLLYTGVDLRGTVAKQFILGGIAQAMK